jgi:prolyl-tRNA synthetase
MGTSHNLGQHFSKVFDIRYEDRNQNLQFVWQTSWGVSTRLIGAVVMTHGDDSGLRLPPQIAPIQVVIVPITLGNWKETILPVAERVERSLRERGVRVKLDAREEVTPGWKFSDWEMRGVPLRLEIGPKDIKENRAVLVRRDIKRRDLVGLEELNGRVPVILKDIQASLYEQALKFQLENTQVIRDYAVFKEVIEAKKGFIKSWWCGDAACEDKIKEETMATIRVVPLNQEREEPAGKCICCGKDAGELVYFARAY